MADHSSISHLHFHCTSTWKAPRIPANRVPKCTYRPSAVWKAICSASAPSSHKVIVNNCQESYSLAATACFQHGFCPSRVTSTKLEYLWISPCSSYISADCFLVPHSQPVQSSPGESLKGSVLGTYCHGNQLRLNKHEFQQTSLGYADSHNHFSLSQISCRIIR